MPSKVPLFKRNIDKDLFDQWRKLIRRGDPEVIAQSLGVSKPTIDKALIYGCVHRQSLIDGITKFFEDRINKEREDASRLSQLQKVNIHGPAEPELHILLSPTDAGSSIEAEASDGKEPA